MKVRILSGDYAGHLAEMDGAELECNLSTGFVGPYTEPVVTPPAPEKTEAPAPAVIEPVDTPDLDE